MCRDAQLDDQPARSGRTRGGIVSDGALATEQREMVSLGRGYISQLIYSYNVMPPNGCVWIPPLDPYDNLSYCYGIVSFFGFNFEGAKREETVFGQRRIGDHESPVER